MKVHTILFVQDQAASTYFYSSLLKRSPILNVPGMTEFQLSDTHILGIMPEQGAKKILGPEIIHSENSSPKSEMYFRVDDPEAYFEQALNLGAKSVSPVTQRNWGDRAGYLMDIDGHIIVFSTL